jgi:magnesium transporter
MGVFMRNVTRDQIVANFEELVADNQINTATDLLISAEPEEQTLAIRQTQPVLLERFVQALDREDRIEVIDQLTREARESLLHILAEVARPGRVAAPETPTDGTGTAAQLIEEAIEEVIERELEPSASVEVIAESPGRMDFAILDGRLRKAAPASAAVTVYSNPTSAAQRELLESLGIDEHMLESALDPDEISRLEFDGEEQQTFIVLKRPHREENGSPELLGVASVGVLLRRDSLIIVTPDDTPLVEDGDRAETPRKLLLRIMASTVNEFLLELKRVKRTSQEIEAKLSKSLENRELLRMFSLSEGLVYHINAIDGNGRVLRKLRHLAQRIGFDEEELEFLNDIVIDNDQCSRQGQIFSTVLGGLLDARGNIINNNMNILLKNLTIINVIFLPLALIAGMGGMSEFTLLLNHYSIDWRVGYPAFFIAMVVIGLTLWFVVRRLIPTMASR